MSYLYKFYKAINAGFKISKSGILQLFLFCVISIPAFSQDYTLSSNGDTHAASPSTSPTDAGGQITLRSAVEAATAIAGAHIITIPGSITTINLTLGKMILGSAAAGNNITINGPGKAVLTINQTTASRVFSTGLNAVTIVIRDLTMNYNGLSGTVSGGGGCIQSGGNGANTTLINVAINNFNIEIGNGGALLNSTNTGTNNLTLTGCDFNNNYAGTYGGAVSYNASSNCIITNCKFNNNKTGPLGATSGLGGGGLSTTGNGNGGTYAVTNCTFTNNQVLNSDGQGGGAILNTNGALTVSFCRFVGNTAATPANGNTITQASGASGQSVTADNNWWGLNSGPAANDKVGGVTVSKWLQLKASAAPNTICANAATTVTASFLSNSANDVLTAANVSVLTGVPVSFLNPVLGTVSAAQATIQGTGTATAIYTASGTSGAGSVNAVVDSVPANDAISKAAVIVTRAVTSSTTVAVCNSYFWNDSTYKLSGDYTYQTTSASGCDSIATLHLTILSVSSSYTKADAQCNGSATGSIIITPTSGAGPYTYRIGTQSNYVATNSFMGLKAGNYRVSILDATGCAGISAQIIIGQQPLLTANINTTPATCNGTSTGSITIAPTNGTSPYMYRLGTTGSFGSSNSFAGLRAATYVAYLSDAHNCTNTFTSIVVGQPAAVDENLVKTDESCAGKADGRITATGMGGMPPYQFKFGTAGTYNTTNMFINLKPGNYRVYVKDANNCGNTSIPISIVASNMPCTPLFGITSAKNNNSPVETKPIKISSFELTLSPNPSPGRFTVITHSADAKQLLQIRVLDINGKIAFQTIAQPEQSVSFGEKLAPGLYLVEVKQGDQVKMIKAIKLK